MKSELGRVRCKLNCDDEVATQHKYDQGGAAQLFSSTYAIASHFIVIYLIRVFFFSFGEFIERQRERVRERIPNSRERQISCCIISIYPSLFFPGIQNFCKHRTFMKFILAQQKATTFGLPWFGSVLVPFPRVFRTFLVFLVLVQLTIPKT